MKYFSRMSLSIRQFFSNSIWTFLELSLYPLLMILATPIFINYLGISEYGLWMLVNNITLAFYFINPGLAETNIKYIAKYRADGDINSIRNVVRYNFSVALLLLLIATVLGYLLSFSHFIQLFNHPTVTGNEDYVLLLASILSGLKFIELFILSVFKGFERFDISSRLGLCSKVMLVITNLMVVVNGGDLMAVFLWSIVILMIMLCVQLFSLYRFNKQFITFPSFKFLWREKTKMADRFWYWLQGSISLGGFLSDKLLVAALTDTITFGYYSIASMVAAQIHNVFLSFGGFAFPRVSYNLSASRVITPMYLGARALIFVPGAMFIVLLILFGDIIFKLWLGLETFEASIIYIKQYLAFESVMLLIIVPYHFLNGSPLIRLNSIFESTLRFMHLLGMLIGFSLFGMKGVIPSLMLTSLMNIPFQYFLFHKKLIPETRSYEHLFLVIPPLFICLMTLNISYFLQMLLLLFFIISIIAFYAAPAKTYAFQLIQFGKNKNR